VIDEQMLEALLGAAEGETAGETAERIGVDPQTIHELRFRVVDELDARCITHAVALAYHTGLLVPRLRAR
jgi:DNA-binding NarL/FixJ family response regulator